MSAVGHPVVGPEWDRVQRGALVAAVAGVVVFVIAGLVLHFAGGLTSPLQFFLSYLVAYNFWLAVALGCLVVLMLQHLTGGAWGIIIRRVLESGSRTLWLLLPLIIPVLIGIPFLYLWAQPDVVEHSEDLQHKAPYFRLWFFILRVVVYFAVWLLLSFFLNRWSTRQDREADLRLQPFFTGLSGPGLVLYGGTITFASIDWVMSLEPYWYSTIYPVLYAAGQLLTGFAFAVAVLILLSTRPPLAGVIKPSHLNDLGSLLLAFTLFWAYMSFSQFLLVYVGNLPEEIPWYLRRGEGPWAWVIAAIAAFGFVVPFILLLMRDVKQNPRRLAGVAVLLLVMRFIDIFWWIEPAYDHEGQYFYWVLDLAALVAVGGVWVWWFIWQLKQRPLLPIHDPYLLEAVRHESHE